MELVIDSCLDALIDCAKLLPFLLITYLLMEWLEAKTEGKQAEKVRSAGPYAPMAGGLLGVIPQCGFSCAAANMYSGGVITVGVLLAVFMSTSDEMLPIFISHAVNISTILRILLVKVVLAVITGYAVDLTNKLVKKHFFADSEKKQQKQTQNQADTKCQSAQTKHDTKDSPDGHTHTRHGYTGEKHIHDLCEQEHCNCKDGIWISALKHTVKIAIFIVIISFVINIIIGFVGEEAIKSAVNGVPVLGEATAALIGLIPNCASSVIITELYLEGVLNAGAMMAGLLTSSGVGLLVLFRMNRHYVKESLKVLVTLYICSLIWGLLISAVGLTF